MQRVSASRDRRIAEKQASRSTREVSAVASPACLEPCALTFQAQLIERPWGGHGLNQYGKNCPDGTLIGESWEISDVEAKASTIAAGRFAGKTLHELMSAHASEVLGAVPAAVHPQGGPQFPLLVKLLDAKQDLSIQVHPSDADLACAGQQANGKTEAWVIFDAEPGARVAHGLAPGRDKGRFLERVQELAGERMPRAEEDGWFRWRPVRRGDVVFVPAGTIHAVGAGIRLLEVQQTSDVTYRLYDWGRVEQSSRQPRPLHLAEARRVGEAGSLPCPWRRLDEFDNVPGFAPVISASDCDKFTLESARLGPGSPFGSQLELTTGDVRGDRFHILTAFSGEARVQLPQGAVTEVRPGGFVLLPAQVGKYVVTTTTGAHLLRLSGAV